MLKLIEEIEECELIDELCNDSFGLTISSLIKAYPPETNLCPAWYQVNGDELTAALCSFNGDLVIWSNIRADYEELKEFINSLGYNNIICRARDIVSLELFACSCGQIWRKEVQNNNVCSYCKPESLAEYKEIYELLELNGDFNEWFADISRRVNKGCAEVRYLKQDGKIVSTASLVHISGNRAILGAVATHKEYRNKGFAKQLINSFASLTVYLRCLPSLNPFYEKLGFKSVDVWAEVKKGK